MGPLIENLKAGSADSDSNTANNLCHRKNVLNHPAKGLKCTKKSNSRL